MIIIYGGAKKTVQKQLKCKHDWHGPCMDRVSRFYKCTKCYCINYDLKDEKEYFERAQ